MFEAEHTAGASRIAKVNRSEFPSPSIDWHKERREHLGKLSKFIHALGPC